MSSGSRRAFATLLTGTALSGSMMGLALAGGTAPVSQLPAATQARIVGSSQPPGAAQAIAGFDPLSQRMLDGRLVSDLPGGGRAELTLEAQPRRGRVAEGCTSPAWWAAGRDPKRSGRKTAKL